MSGDGRDGDTTVSPDALRLHAAGLLASFEAGHAGLITAADLRSLGDSTAALVVELCVAGVWQQLDGGYRVVSSEALRMVTEVHRELHEPPDRQL